MTITKIKSIENLMDIPIKIGQLFSYFSNLCLYSLKMHQMNLNMTDNYVFDEYFTSFSEGLKTLSTNYQTYYQENFSVLNYMRDEQNNPTANTSIFSLGKPFSVRVSIFEFFFKILNSVLEIEERPNSFRPIYLYFLNVNFFEYSAIIESFMETINQRMYDESVSLNTKYLIFGSAILGYLLIILVLGIIIMRKISQYNEKVLLLISRLTLVDINKEIGMLQMCKNIFCSNQNKKNNWKQVAFSNIILQYEDYYKNYLEHNQHDHEFNNYFSSQDFTHNEIFHSNHKAQVKSKFNQQNIDQNNLNTNKNQQNLIENVPKKEILPTKASQSSERNYKIRQKKQSEVNKFKSTSSNISSQIQGTYLKDWPLQSMFIFILLISGIFFFIVLILAYITSISLQPGVQLMKNTSQFYTLFHKQIFVNEYLAVVPIMNLVDPDYPAHYNQTLMTNFENDIENLSGFMNTILQDISNIKSIAQFSSQSFSQLFSKDACSYLQNETICNENISDLSQNKQFLRSAVSHGISGIVTGYQSLFKNLNFLIKGDDLEKKITQSQEYLNSELTVGLTFNSFSTPMQYINLLFQQTNQYCQDLISENKNLVLIYYLTIGSVLVFLQFIIDMLFRKKMRHKIRRINLALSFIPTSIAQEEITIQLLKSILKM